LFTGDQPSIWGPIEPIEDGYTAADSLDNENVNRYRSYAVFAPISRGGMIAN